MWNHLITNKISYLSLLNIMKSNSDQKYKKFLHFEKPVFKPYSHKEYDTVTDGRNDNFDKINRFISISFYFSGHVKITEVQFFELANILAQVGGFNGAIFSIFGILCTLSFQLFIRTLAKDIGGKDSSK